MLGNGTSGVQAVAPSTSGNVLVSNGTTWVSQAPAGGGVTSLNGQTGAITNTNFDAIGSYATLMNVTNSDLGQGSTKAGSSLRSGANGNIASGSATSLASQNARVQKQTGNNSYAGGGSAVSGTWRKMDASQLYQYDSYSKGFTAYWGLSLYVRIS